MFPRRLKPSRNNQERRSPYCAFRSDRHRLWALVSRDIRSVLIAAAICSWAPWLPHSIIQLLR